MKFSTIFLLIFLSTHYYSLALISNIRAINTRAFTRQLAKSQPVSTDKIRIRVQKNVNGQGRIGDTILVSRAYWLNYLQPQKAGIIISDDQIAREQAESAKSIAEDRAKAIELSERINQLPLLTIRRKAGTSGQLFGAVTDKQIIELLVSQYPVGMVSAKDLAVKEIFTCIENKSTGVEEECTIAIEELKKIGHFKIVMGLHHNYSASFKVEIVKEN